MDSIVFFLLSLVIVIIWHFVSLYSSIRRKMVPKPKEMGKPAEKEVTNQHASSSDGMLIIDQSRELLASSSQEDLDLSKENLPAKDSLADNKKGESEAKPPDELPLVNGENGPHDSSSEGHSKVPKKPMKLIPLKEKDFKFSSPPYEAEINQGGSGTNYKSGYLQKKKLAQKSSKGVNNSNNIFSPLLDSNSEKESKKERDNEEPNNFFSSSGYSKDGYFGEKSGGINPFDLATNSGSYALEQMAKSDSTDQLASNDPLAINYLDEKEIGEPEGENNLLTGSNHIGGSDQKYIQMSSGGRMKKEFSTPSLFKATYNSFSDTNKKERFGCPINWNERQQIEPLLFTYFLISK